MKVTIADVRKLVREALEGFDDGGLEKLDVAHEKVGDFKTASFNALPALENLDLAIESLLDDVSEDTWIVPVQVEDVVSLKRSLDEFKEKLHSVKLAIESQKI